MQTILPEIQNGTVTLMVVLDQPGNPLLRNRLRVDASIVTEQKADALVAATGTAFNGKGLQDVYVISNGVARKRRLEIGLGDGDSVEVISGARAGDRLVVSDTARFKHLDSIRVTE